MIRANTRPGFAPIAPQQHINAETIRHESRRRLHRAAAVTTATALALALGALLAAAQITLAALPDIIAQSAARNAW